ncbi:uncharacterized protein TNCV_2787871 [Trichonephila clavipes]|uniref:Uncharacterized protein n=1 Tax=Trichonephila clavipes TaxID=2585209 RepID=A0A8X6SWH7_TRICX|nr:uncharacterized protein TNCV_2787871 [Trichonephila clavipes]
MHIRLLSGFPVIASTSGLIRKAVKILVFIVSLCGFLYQTSEFLELYRAYPTMVDIKVEYPDVITLPAITVCNKNRLKRSVYCLANPADCRWFGNRTQFCWLNPKYCSPEMSDEEMVLAMPILQRYNVSRNTEDLEIYGMRRSDLLGECIVQTQKGKFPCKREYHPFGIAALLPRFESQLNNHRICSSNELHQVIPILTLLTEH